MDIEKTAFLSSLDALASFGSHDMRHCHRVAQIHPFKISSHFLGLIRFPGDAIWRQVVPESEELEQGQGYEDPLSEEALSPVPNLVHRYPRRVLWLISHECALHCRFCTRKRRWAIPNPLTEELFESGLQYIREHQEIQDVLLSGGDPLLLPFDRIESILIALRSISHVEIIRIGTRVPCAFPQRVTPYLAGMLAKYHPLYVNIHFNHPWELTAESCHACNLLANAGIPLGSQTVLLRGINDKASTLGELFQKLLTLRVRPYYLMQMDLTQGTTHFRTPLSTGLNILKSLRNYISGMAMPQLVLDLPGGHGKIPLVPRYVEGIFGDHLIVRNYRGQFCRYPLLPGEDRELGESLKKL